MSVRAFQFCIFGRQTLALAFLLVLQACGGGGGGTPTSAEVQFSSPNVVATVSDCDRVSVNDSGHVVYVVMDAACPTDTEARTVELSMGTGGELDPATTLSITRRVGAVEGGVEEVPGLGARSVHLLQRGQWREVPHNGTWAPRDGAGLLQLGRALYLLGGWLWGPATNEVWRTVDLVNWEFVGYAPWPARHGAAWLVHDDRLWVIGGDFYQDVWSSPDGQQWTQETALAPFGARYTPNAASLNGEIYVYGGLEWPGSAECSGGPSCVRGLLSAWKSRDGRQWDRVTEQVPWAGRALVHGSAVHDGELFVIGGGLKASVNGSPTVETTAEFTDVWSSPDGKNWRQRTTDAGFTGRTHFSLLTTSSGCFVSDGSVGTQANLSNDLYFAADCIRFTPLPVPANVPRRHASSFIKFNGTLVLLGGPPHFEGPVDSVWQFVP